MNRSRRPLAVSWTWSRFGYSSGAEPGVASLGVGFKGVLSRSPPGKKIARGIGRNFGEWLLIEDLCYKSQ
jgi:hypothetical protein